MNRATILPLCLLLALWSWPAFSQSDLLLLSNPAFTPDRRPPARFPHDEHNAKANLEDCGRCHHGETDGKMDSTASTEGQACVECHPVSAPKGRTPLRQAYHRQCQTCHEQAGKGPLACGQCHQIAR